MNSGVRNLRAMFEQSGAASSPEPRGRSPGSSSAVEDDTSRPTSKVRASFVSVEHTVPHASDFGTNKGIPSNSAAAHRRESFSVSEDTAGEVAELKRIITEEKEERRKSHAIVESIPEQAVASRESSAGPPPLRNEPDGEMVNLGAIMKGSDFPEPSTDSGLDAPQSNEALAPELPSVEEEPVKEEQPAPAPAQEAPAENPDKAVTGAQEEVSLKPADLTDAAAVSGGKALSPPAEELQPASTESAPDAPAEPAVEIPEPAASSAKLNGTSATEENTEQPKKPAAISTAKASTSKGAPLKSPMPRGAPKTPTTPKHSAAAPVSKPTAPAPKPAAAAKPAAKRAASREPPKAAAPKPKTSHTSLRASTATAPTATAKAKTSPTEHKKPVTTKPKDPTATSPTGLKKPKPRSPTRPVGLPSRLTAPTAASAAKLHGEEAQKEKVTRKPSTTARPAPKPAATRPSRPSVAPPSASTNKRPESRASTVGGAPSFLERMMRPTTASASKTHEKPTSPPRKAPAKSSILQKGKKKVEEVATKAKDAVTSNGHADEPAKTELTDGTSAHTENAVEPVAESLPEPSADPVDQAEPVKAETSVPEADSSVVEVQTPNFQDESAR